MRTRQIRQRRARWRAAKYLRASGEAGATCVARPLALPRGIIPRIPRGMTFDVRACSAFFRGRAHAACAPTLIQSLARAEPWERARRVFYDDCFGLGAELRAALTLLLGYVVGPRAGAGVINE